MNSDILDQLVDLKLILPLPDYLNASVFLFQQDIPVGIAHRLYSMLSPAEKVKASQFLSTLLKDRYISRHGIVRCLLGQALEVSPELVEIETARHGKPYIPAEDVFFNISSSGVYGIVGISQYRPIGIDIEKVVSEFDYRDIVSNYFSDEEQEQVLSANHDDQRTTFYAIWTRKEADAKMAEIGLGAKFRSYGSNATNLSLPTEGYCAAIAIKNKKTA